MKTATVTVSEFVEKNKITMKADIAGVGKMNEKDTQEMDHWKCEFSLFGAPTKYMTIDFYTGFGHRKGLKKVEPKPEAVLGCLISDAVGLDCAPLFEDWAAEYGYDTDSKSAERIYFAVQHQTNRLIKFLGRELYNEALNTETY